VALELKTKRRHAVARMARRRWRQPADVVGVVGQRLLDGFAHRLEGREVHHGVDAVAAEQRSSAAASQTSARSNTGARPASRCSRFSTTGELLEKSSTPTTSKPAACSASQVCEARCSRWRR
jgi:hypothetical protein